MNRTEQIQARWGKSTPGPWFIHNKDFAGEYQELQIGGSDHNPCFAVLHNDQKYNAEAIASAPADIAYLLHKNAALRSIENLLADFCENCPFYEELCDPECRIMVAIKILQEDV